MPIERSDDYRNTRHLDARNAKRIEVVGNFVLLNVACKRRQFFSRGAKGSTPLARYVALAHVGRRIAHQLCDDEAHVVSHGDNLPFGQVKRALDQVERFP